MCECEPSLHQVLPRNCSTQPLHRSNPRNYFGCCAGFHAEDSDDTDPEMPPFCMEEQPVDTKYDRSKIETGRRPPGRRPHDLLVLELSRRFRSKPSLGAIRGCMWLAHQRCGFLADPRPSLIPVEFGEIPQPLSLCPSEPWQDEVEFRAGLGNGVDRWKRGTATWRFLKPLTWFWSVVLRDCGG